MPYKKKAPAKRTKKAVGGALSAAQKRLLGQAQAGAVKKGAGAITKQIVNYTRKHGDQRKAASAPAKSKTGRSIRAKTPAERMGGQLSQQKRTRTRTSPSTTKQRGGIAMSKTARANLMRMQREAFKTGKSNPRLAALTKKHGMLVKRGDAQKQMQSQRRRPAVGSRMTPAQRRAAARKRAMMLARKRRAPSRRTRPATGRLTAAQRRARMASARRRAMAAARKRKAPSRRIKRPVRRPSVASRGLSRSALLRARRGRRPVARGRRGLGRAVRATRRVMRRR
jgi:hypothetical protein